MMGSIDGLGSCGWYLANMNEFAGAARHDRCGFVPYRALS